MTKIAWFILFKSVLSGVTSSARNSARTGLTDLERSGDLLPQLQCRLGDE